MELMRAGLSLLLFCSAYSYRLRSGGGYGLFVQDPELEWERMGTVIGEDETEAPAPKSNFWRSASGSDSSVPVAKKIPEYVVVSAAEDQKEAFKPEKGARPLPKSVKDMLLMTASPSPAASSATRKDLIDVLCHVDRMYVRIRREVFKTTDAYKYLKLGTCPVNQGTKEHYYFLYLLNTDCGFKKESNADDRSITIALRYKPTTTVIREMPFDIPLQCKFPRLFHSYKVGFYPKLQGGTVYKSLQRKSSFTLTPQDGSGNEITGAKTYILGKPMHFEAKPADNTKRSGGQRLYVDKCFMTASQNPNSNPKYTVIDNKGCMVDGKVTQQSKFLTGASKMAQKFSVGAMLFKDMVSSSSSPQQLYIHCEISLGKLTPTQSSKACNYDTKTKKWKELYGDDYVCTCCDSTCSSGQTKASRSIVSSHSWKVDLSSKERDVEGNIQMKSFNPDAFSLEDPDIAEHSDFLNYWDHDY